MFALTWAFGFLISDCPNSFLEKKKYNIIKETILNVTFHTTLPNYLFSIFDITSCT